VLKPLIFAIAFMSTNVFAAWQLDNQNSDLSFTSIKKIHIAENHHFKKLHGQIDAQGQLQLEIDLSSVESMIPIRNQRMQSMLFNVTNFPSGKVSANVSEQLSSLKNGTQIIKGVNASLELHGHKQNIRMDLVVNKYNTQLHIAPLRAILINSTSYGLTSGIEALRKIAGLDTIATTVPVTFSLTFNEKS